MLAAAAGVGMAFRETRSPFLWRFMVISCEIWLLCGGGRHLLDFAGCTVCSEYASQVRVLPTERPIGLITLLLRSAIVRVGWANGSVRVALTCHQASCDQTSQTIPICRVSKAWFTVVVKADNDFAAPVG